MYKNHAIRTNKLATVLIVNLLGEKKLQEISPIIHRIGPTLLILIIKLTCSAQPP